jgi:hypothetical protein
VVLIIVLRNGQLTGYQECFYRISALQYLSDPLFFPNLYNVAQLREQPCWLCLANLGPLPQSWEEKIRIIRNHLWGGGFNKSSEVHEGMSYWHVMRHIDRRVKSLEAWEAASRIDPLFPLRVKWQPVGLNAGQVMQELLSYVTPAPALLTRLRTSYLLSITVTELLGRGGPFSLARWEGSFDPGVPEDRGVRGARRVYILSRGTKRELSGAEDRAVFLHYPSRRNSRAHGTGGVHRAYVSAGASRDYGADLRLFSRRL